MTIHRAKQLAAAARMLFALALLAAFAASACNVPVFRYALERWPSENYEAFVFHKGAFTPADQQRLSALSNSIQQLNANLNLRLVDLSDSRGMAEEKLW